MRGEHQRDFIRSHVAAIPASPDQWRTGDLLEDVILPFELRDPATNKWYPMQLGLVGYNVEPPRLTVRHPTHGGPTWDPRHWPPQLLEPALHPVTGRPFCCVLGLQDYHSHPRHIDRPWDTVRNTRGLDAIIADIADRLTPGKFPRVANVARPM